MEECQYFEYIVTVLEQMQRDGVSVLSSSDSLIASRFNEALKALSVPPINSAASELLVRKVFEIFADTAIVDYQREMCNGEECLALSRLHERYQHTLAFVSDCCTKMHSKECVAVFTVSLRCALLQPDLLTRDYPPGRKELLCFLRAHGRKLLLDIEGTESFPSFLCGVSHCHDTVLQQLHELTLASTPDLRALWRSVLVNSISSRIDELDNNFTVARIQSCMKWKDSVVNTFVCVALSPDPDDSELRSEVNRWCEDLEQLLLVSFGRKRIASFWDVVVDYPDSTPTLQDIRFCLLRCADDTLRSELIQTTKGMLASRLHRAGTCTEYILDVLINTIHSLCVLLSKNDQSSVIFTIVGDTLEHLKKRKDCVSAVVRAITQPSADTVLHAELSNYNTENAVDDSDTKDDMGASQDEPDHSPLSIQEKPDVLRVLLSTISVNLLVEEYRQALASKLLGRPMHKFDTTPEEEVLERLKCAFGEDVLAPCVVMIRDIQSSRRYTEMVKDAHRGAVPSGVSPRQLKRDWPLSLDVLSATSWPKLSTCPPPGESIPLPDRYNPHPEVASAMQEAMAEYKRLKANQCLEWVLSHGFVTLELKQQDFSSGSIVAVTYDLSVFLASVVLYVRDISSETNSSVPLTLLEERMHIKWQVIQQRISHILPSVLVYADEQNSLSLQTNYVSAANFTFDEAKEVSEQPAGLSQEQLEVFLPILTAMLRARGACAVNVIFNSMKMLGGFTGTIDDMKRLLHDFVAKGNLTYTDDKLFALPRE
ncbi:hypothetical protein TRVL_05901 [Trypanosoma vivax]|nr:hypothetical protein TRVL_05901 [Trypanosoma vivax]